MSGNLSPRAAHPALVLFALAMGGFAIGTTEFGTMGLVPYFAHSFGISDPRAGHVISAYALGVVVGAPVIAVLGRQIAAPHAARRFDDLLRHDQRAFRLCAELSVDDAFSGFSPACRMAPISAWASLVAASLVPVERRAQAISRILLGLTVATIFGVPAANVIGQVVGWRWAFALVTVLGLATAILVLAFAPRGEAQRGGSPLAELAILKKPSGLAERLASARSALAGMFAVYTYLASTLLYVTHASPAVRSPRARAFSASGSPWAILSAPGSRTRR